MRFHSSSCAAVKLPDENLGWLPPSKEISIYVSCTRKADCSVMDLNLSRERVRNTQNHPLHPTHRTHGHVHLIVNTSNDDEHFPEFPPFLPSRISKCPRGGKNGKHLCSMVWEGGGGRKSKSESPDNQEITILLTHPKCERSGHCVHFMSALCALL